MRQRARQKVSKKDNKDTNSNKNNSNPWKKDKEVEEGTDKETDKKFNTNKNDAKELKLMKCAQRGMYIKPYIAKIKTFVADNNKIGVIHLGQTTQEQAMIMFKDKPVMILALEKEMVGYILTHRYSRQEVWSRMFQFDEIEKLLNKFDKQATPDFKNWLRLTPKRFQTMTSQAAKESSTSRNFLGDLTSDVELGNKTPAFKLLGVITEYAFSTLQTPALVDELNAIFFPESVKKKRITKLINDYQKHASSRLAENGGYMVRYIAKNMLNPEHLDSKDDKIIPSTLLYGGKFASEMSFLKLSKYEISIPISKGTIISFFAACIDHEVCVYPVFLANKQRFDTRIIEVFGSYESVYEHLKTKDKEVKEAAAKIKEAAAKVAAA
ncbi:hypothetical protein HDU80_010593 [Chytriomyces hyalinus]|nr:hypothetical protein HDU80_010593 [Chytriomyces hyalinus]